VLLILYRFAGKKPPTSLPGPPPPRHAKPSREWRRE
jgi:hypothetical protein